MQQWKHKIELADLWKKFQDEENITYGVNHLAQDVATRIKGASFYDKYEDQDELEHIVHLFEELGKDECAEICDFDPRLELFYRWGDRDKRVWINTF